MASPENCLLGKIISDNPITDKQSALIISILTNMWKKHMTSSVTISPWSNNIFSFVFENETDATNILNHDSPWSVMGFYLSLLPWDMDKTLNEMNFDNARFWVQVHDLPLGMLTSGCAKTIGGLLGRVVELDCVGEGLQTGREFLRLRVEVDVRKLLLPGFYVPRADGRETWVSLKYEGLCDFCHRCGCLGHRTGSCSNEVIKEYAGKWSSEMRTSLAPRFQAQSSNSPSASIIPTSRSSNSTTNAPNSLSDVIVNNTSTAAKLPEHIANGNNPTHPSITPSSRLPLVPRFQAQSSNSPSASIIPTSKSPSSTTIPPNSLSDVIVNNTSADAKLPEHITNGNNPTHPSITPSSSLPMKRRHDDLQEGENLTCNIESVVKDRYEVYDPPNETPSKMKDATKKHFIPRMIDHPRFKDVSVDLAEKFLFDKEPAENILRPSSRGPSYLTLSLKMYDEVYAHTDILLGGKDNQDTTSMLNLGKTLEIGEVVCADEVIARVVDPLVGHLKKMLCYRMFKHGTKAEVDESLRKEKSEHPLMIVFCFSICHEYPGSFILTYIGTQSPKVHNEYVGLHPKGFVFRTKMFEEIDELVAYFLKHVYEPYQSVNLAAIGGPRSLNTGRDATAGGLGGNCNKGWGRWRWRWIAVSGGGGSRQGKQSGDASGSGVANNSGLCVKEENI